MQRILSDFAQVEVLDRKQNSIHVNVAVYQYGESVSVFLSELGNARRHLAANTAIVIEQLARVLDVDVATTSFFKHISVPAVGSLFGVFGINWKGEQVSSYTLNMLHGIHEEQGVRNILSEGIQLPVVELA